MSFRPSVSPLFFLHDRYYQTDKAELDKASAQWHPQSHSSLAQEWKISYLLFQTGVQTSLRLKSFQTQLRWCQVAKGLLIPEGKIQLQQALHSKPGDQILTSFPLKGKSPMNAPQYRNTPQCPYTPGLPLTRGISDQTKLDRYQSLVHLDPHPLLLFFISLGQTNRRHHLHPTLIILFLLVQGFTKMAAPLLQCISW